LISFFVLLIKSWFESKKKGSKQINKKKHLYTPDEESLYLVLAKLREFEQDHKRLPKSGDPGLGGIVAAVKKGIWKEFGVKTWNQMLRRAFNRINVEREIYTADLIGLRKAKKQLQKFHSSHKKYPMSTDEGMGTIVNAINLKKWVKFGINRWKDLFQQTFGIDPKILRQSPYEGKQGLKQAQNELHAFKVKHERLPRFADKELNPIRHMATSGRWKQWGIQKWNDLIRLTFNEVTYEHGKYLGKAGLDRAIQEIQVFHNKHGRQPKTRDQGMGSMQKAIQRKYWVEYSVNSWLDLIELAMKKEE